VNVGKTPSRIKIGPGITIKPEENIDGNEDESDKKFDIISLLSR
jgi:hypothetical protein